MNSYNSISFFLASKFNYICLFNIPRFNGLNFSISYLSKSKLKYLVFFILMLSLMFISYIMKVGNIKKRPLTTIFLSCRSEKNIFLFLKNFIYFHFPTLDTFISKIHLTKLGSCSVDFSLKRFPSIMEADLLLADLEDLSNLYNLSHINFSLTFMSSLNKLDYLAFSHFNHIPILANIISK